MNVPHVSLDDLVKRLVDPEIKDRNDTLRIMLLRSASSTTLKTGYSDVKFWRRN